jgi:hypothetical protein
MARNKVQFQKGLIEAVFAGLHGTEVSPPTSEHTRTYSQELVEECVSRVTFTC